MSSGPTLSRYTPSLMGRDLLERLFVARDRLLDEIVRRVGAAARSTERNHTLLVGPRGAGKTHLVSLVYHRTKDLMAEGQRVQVAWLPEDPWTLVSYRHVLAEIVTRLEPSFEDPVPRSPAELEGILARRTAELGPVVVIVENLDQILQAIGDDGQQRLRHLLQSDRSLLFIATSTTLDRSVSDQASPFYAFFTTSRLEPFDVEEAAEMLTAIAREREDEELVGYLAGEEGRARLRTIEHLAGGQPRMWAALASALTVEGLDDLVDLLLTRFDDLTPYYQEQLGRLSGQQRLVVAELAEVDRPITVKELAERLEIDQRSLGKTVSDLVERRWMAETTSPVTAMLDQRRTYYELAEPMARLSFQIKDNRGEPLRVIVDFLKHWFDPPDLKGAVSRVADAYMRLASADQARDPVVSVARRLSGLPNTTAPSSSLLGNIDDALAELAKGEPDRFLRLAAPVRTALERRLQHEDNLDMRLDVHAAALDDLEPFGRNGAERWVERAESLVRTDARCHHRAALQLARWQAVAGHLDQALATWSAAGPSSGGSRYDRTVATMAIGMNLAKDGRHSEASAFMTRHAMESEAEHGTGDLLTLTLWLIAGTVTIWGRDLPASLRVVSRIEASDAASKDPLLHVMVSETRARVLWQSGRRAEAWESQAQAVVISAEHLGVERAAEAIALLETMDPD